MIHFACTGCGKKVKAADELVGRRVRCTRCGSDLVVPRLNSSTTEFVISEQMVDPPASDSEEAELSLGELSCGLGTVACLLCLVAIILAVAYSDPPESTGLQPLTTIERANYKMPTWVKVTIWCLVAPGFLASIGGIILGLAGLNSSGGDDGLCWLGLIVSSFPLCLLACLVIVVAALLLMTLSASAAQRKRRIIIEE